MLTAGAALGGWAAAYVLGANWLDGLDPWTMQPLPIDVVAPSRHRNRELIRFRYTRQPPTIITRYGIPLTASLQTAVDGPRWADSIEEALVFLDAMVEAKILTPGSIVSYVARSSSLHGLDQVRAAADLVRSNVWSPWESRLRYCYQVEAGLPEPVLNVRLFDDEGVFLGNPDLFDQEAALAAEFDGKHHREREQHRKDNIREERFESVNVTTVRADSLDLRRSRRPLLIARIRDGYRRGLRRDRRYDRWLIDPRAWDYQPWPTPYNDDSVRSCVTKVRRAARISRTFVTQLLRDGPIGRLRAGSADLQGGQPRADSISGASSSGVTLGWKRLINLPSRSIRNLAKFHSMSGPSSPGCSVVSQW